jgi:HAD superfamily hydrolase (TIGR01509 family)
MRRPTAVLLDLDDTILNDSLNVDDCWQIACGACRDQHADIDGQALVTTIARIRDWFWADRDRHRTGRLDLFAARREIVRLSLAEHGIDRPALADSIASIYGAVREERMEPLPGAIDTVKWLRASGCRLALLTNGGGAAQRKKIERFDLAVHFDLILIEGELGFGKPDARVFEAALRELDVAAEEAWMVGDNLEWDIQAPQRLGMFAIWVDAGGRGIPETSDIRPDRIIRKLADLRMAEGTPEWH